MKRTKHSGFTLIEALVALALAGVMALIFIPLGRQALVRAELEGAARQTVALLQQARAEAIRNGFPVVVRADLTTGDVESFSDADDDQSVAPDDRLHGVSLPSGVAWRAPGSQVILEGVPDGEGRPLVVFEPDGSLRQPSVLRLGDERGNYLEVRIAPEGAPQTKIRKWNGSSWLLPGEGGRGWEWL